MKKKLFILAYFGAALGLLALAFAPGLVFAAKNISDGRVQNLSVDNTLKVLGAATLSGGTTLAAGDISGTDIADGTIQNADLEDSLIDSTSIADGAVTSAGILDGTVANADMAADAIDSPIFESVAGSATGTILCFQAAGGIGKCTADEDNTGITCTCAPL